MRGICGMGYKFDYTLESLGTQCRQLQHRTLPRWLHCLHVGATISLLLYAFSHEILLLNQRRVKQSSSFPSFLPILLFCIEFSGHITCVCERKVRSRLLIVINCLWNFPPDVRWIQIGVNSTTLWTTCQCSRATLCHPETWVSWAVWFVFISSYRSSRISWHISTYWIESLFWCSSVPSSTSWWTLSRDVYF